MSKQVFISDELYSLIEKIRTRLEKELGIGISFSQASRVLYFQYQAHRKAKPKIGRKLNEKEGKSYFELVLDDFNLFK